MAGDWIKMRTDLIDDPAVIVIGEATGLETDHVVGKLHRLWSWADRHTQDGCCIGVSMAWVDKYLSSEGFASAMVKAGWLAADDSTGIRFPKFDEHNSKSAKKRANGSLRIAAHRQAKTCNASVTPERYSSVTEALQERYKSNTSVTPECYTKTLVPRALRRFVLERDGYKCVYCGRAKGQIGPMETKQDALLSLDHVIPESQGGDVSPNNLVTCCNSCNRKKANKTPDECGFDWPTNALQERYGSVTEALQERYKSVTGALPEKRREEYTKETNTKKSRSPFVAPTLEQVADYIRAKNYHFKAEAFLAYYTANGWVQGRGKPIKDWQAACRTWECNREEEQHSVIPTADEDRTWTP